MIVPVLPRSDFVRRHRVDIIDFNGIKDEEHRITQLEVNRYWGHL